MARAFHIRMALQRLSKILRELDEGEDHDLPQEDILILFSGASFDEKLEQARRLADEHNCQLLYTEYSRDPATFYKMPSW